MDGSLPRSAVLPPGVLQSAMKGLMTLRELELGETRRLLFEPETTPPCSTSKCPSRTRTSPVTLGAYRKVFNHVVGSSRFGTKVLQVPEFYVDCGGELQCVGGDVCSNCVEGWEVRHANLRKEAWVKLPEVFGLRG